MNIVDETARALLDLFAPTPCCACGAPSPRSALCDPCAVSCVDATDPLPGIEVAHDHGGALARAVHRAKYGGDPCTAARLGTLVLPLLSRVTHGVDVVVPVALHRSRLRVRGYNQAMELARPVARALRVGLWAEGLRRVRDTPTQTELGREARARNVDGAFVAARPMTGLRVLVVDDVVTTGATLGAAMEALRGAGAEHVTGLAVARMARLFAR